MGDEPYTMQRMTLSQGSKRSTSPHQAAYAAERAKVLFGSYRRGDANDPDAYVAAIGAVLSTYDADLIREVTDPRTGIATSEKFMSFMPNAGELKVFCDGVAVRREKIKRLAELPKVAPVHAMLPPPPRHSATTFIDATHYRYAEAMAWTKTADAAFWRVGKSPDGRNGVWVYFDEFDGPARQPRPQTPVARPPVPMADDPDAWRARMDDVPAMDDGWMREDVA